MRWYFLIIIQPLQFFCTKLFHLYAERGIFIEAEKNTEMKMLLFKMGNFFDRLAMPSVHTLFICSNSIKSTQKTNMKTKHLLGLL